MTEPTLVVMAAGLGSRYGGLKQIDSIGPGGEIILDYSVYDALRSGFHKVVLIIRRDIEKVVRDRIGRALERHVQVEYVFQEIANLPEGFTVPVDRTKPWGTGHAVMSCRGAIDTPFAVINADDYYGPTAFAALGEYLRSAEDHTVYDYCMVGYAIGNTLSENGDVARGVCDLADSGDIVGIHERTQIQRRPDGISYTKDGEDWIVLPDDTIVSLNAWGFTPSFLVELHMRFESFLKSNSENLSRAEYFLPSVVGELVTEGKARVKLLPTGEKWFGVTYQEDRPKVQSALRDLIDAGVYPERLWI
ncbi:MAG: nucleotidyltransferase [Armatimonadota bacterium]